MFSLNFAFNSVLHIESYGFIQLDVYAISRDNIVIVSPYS